MTTLTLRPYQTEALDAATREWAEGTRRTAIVLPTGTGKTVIMAHAALRELAQRDTWVRDRVLILVDRDELVTQTVNKLVDVIPGARIGVVKAERNDHDAPIVVASVQTLARVNRIRQLSADAFALVIVDECHLRPDQVSRILHYFGCYSADGRVPARALGFTATMIRDDKKRLSDVWQSICFERSVLWAIANGFLVDPRALAVTLPDLDLKDVRRTGADFEQEALGDAMVSSADAIVNAWMEHASERLTVAFQPNLASADALREAFLKRSVPTGYVDGTTPAEERRLTYKAHTAGELRVIVNCNVLTVGWDSPETSCAILPPTASRAKFRQQAGRVLRPAPWVGKSDALLMITGPVTPSMTLIGMGDLADSDVKPRDGESLRDAVQREASTPKAKQILEEIHMEEVDLFGETPVRWLRTTAGHPFVPLMDWTVFLVPDGVTPAGDLTFSVGALWTGKGKARKPERRDQGLPIESAIGRAEHVAMALDAESDAGFSVARKGASWRKKPASELMIIRARQMGIVVDEDERIRAGKLSDQMAIVTTSKWLDPLAPKTPDKER